MRKVWFFFFCIYIVSILILGLFMSYKLGIELKYEQEKQTGFVVSEPFMIVRPLNGSDFSNSTIAINMSHIAEIKESNGSLIIEIRKEGMQSHGLNIEYNNNITELIK